MPSLIQLNGPPGIGKSTISALYADRHPGTLNLDIDSLHRLVGGWRDDSRTHDILRPVALAMAGTHLAGGRDVVVPQLLTRSAEVDVFAQVATEQGADFHEIVLIDDRAEALARFERRVDDSEWGRHNVRVVADLGGATVLGALYDQLLDLIRRRPDAVVVRSEAQAVEETYAAFVEALGPR